MTEYLKTALLFLISPKCYEEYFTRFNFLHYDCMKATVSKGLGLGIIAGSFTVKVPQIIKIANNQSGDGINLLSVLLDLFAITSNASYSFVKGFPFSAWGDGVFLAVQTAVIALLVLHYGRRSILAAIFVASYAAIAYTLIGGIVPLDVLWSMQVLNVPIVVAGKGLQAVSNYQNKSTGQLSAATCWLLFAGSTARIFTSIQETGDRTLIFTYMIASLLNGVIVAQLIYYGRASKKAKKH